MAFPSTGGTQQQSLSEAWDHLRTTAGIIKGHALRLKNDPKPMPASDIIASTGEIARARTRFAATAQVQGLVDYARAQISNPTIDVVAEGTAMVAAADAVVNWVVANFPKDASGWLLAQQWGSTNGVAIPRQITAAQMTNLMPLLDTLIASID